MTCVNIKIVNKYKNFLNNQARIFVFGCGIFENIKYSTFFDDILIITVLL